VTTELPLTDATRLRRKPERGDRRRDTIHAVIDEALVAHVGFVVDDQPFVIPMTYGRDGDVLYLHGSVANRTLRALDTSPRVCATFTLLDGLVLARSHFHHSMNYRSVVLLGTARRVRDAARCRRALGCIVDHVVPGRTSEARPPSDAELRQTAVVELPIEEASAKVRTGGPVEEPADLELDVWGGVIPVQAVFGRPEADGQGLDAATPPSVSGYSRP